MNLSDELRAAATSRGSSIVQGAFAKVKEQLKQCAAEGDRKTPMKTGLNLTIDQHKALICLLEDEGIGVVEHTEPHNWTELIW